MQLRLTDALAFGALISAVDPVATLAIFSAMDVEPVLNMLGTDIKSHISATFSNEMQRFFYID